MCATCQGNEKTVPEKAKQGSEREKESGKRRRRSASRRTLLKSASPQPKHAGRGGRPKPLKHIKAGLLPHSQKHLDSDILLPDFNSSTTKKRDVHEPGKRDDRWATLSCEGHRVGVAKVRSFTTKFSHEGPQCI